MGKTYESIDAGLREFIAAQPLFFTATAPTGPDGHVNVSPKGMAGCFAVLPDDPGLTRAGPLEDPLPGSPDAGSEAPIGRVAYLDYTGSGAESIAHLRQNGRITIMFCAFEGRPKIVRLYGRGLLHFPGDPGFAALRGRFPRSEDHGLRAIIEVEVHRISSSCGFAVPLMDFVGDRDLLEAWADKRTPEKLVEYRTERNALSIDGLPGYPVPAAPVTSSGAAASRVSG
ncbi:pyridoxamine 5'-phosphate oxidase family protein [Longispora sp. NPDC051575]|uniref:pyridoxamine 5'-phosphate oxidase family protein n=1 Tax=Longispora sp. NPDC051575 TaxID=3154943 RepID=UPI003414F7D1